jgi:hypothetical protein
MWPILSLTKLPTVLVSKRFNQKADYEEPIQVVQEFDPQLKIVMEDYMMCLIVYNFQICSKKKKIGQH